MDLLPLGNAFVLLSLESIVVGGTDDHKPGLSPYPFASSPLACRPSV